MELKAEIDLVGFVKELVVAMGLSESVFSSTQNGLHLKIDEANLLETEISIGLWRTPNATNKPLFKLRWHKNDRIFIFFTAVGRPIFPLKKIIGSLEINGNGECLVNKEQAMIILCTMLKYLELESGLQGEVKKGWAKKIEVTA